MVLEPVVILALPAQLELCSRMALFSLIFDYTLVDGSLIHTSMLPVLLLISASVIENLSCFDRV